MDCSRIVFSRHALVRMFERAINDDDVRAAIVEGEVIAAYPQDSPNPSVLLLGWIRGRPLHVVVAQEADSLQCVVVTAYEPERSLWEQDFRHRRR